MGYYANGSGFVVTRPLSLKEKTKLLKEIQATDMKHFESDAFSVVSLSLKGKEGKEVMTIDIDHSDNYHEENVYDFLRKIAPYVETGKIEFDGEAHDNWRFHFRNGKWYEDNGIIIYDEEKGKEIL